MKDVKDEKSCHSQTAAFLGVVFIVVATLLTLFTLDGFGIFGLFLVGILLLKKSCCAGCKCGCNTGHMSCELPKLPKLSKLSKAIKTKTTAKKATKK